ncbi:MAG: hypothetical protein LH478_04805 [Chitinophagaceae bacterium]|nr:hypothetical protein [Chitinophagaceae bacterium]
MKRSIYLAVFFACFSFVSFGQAKWELAKNKNGIKVFTSVDGFSKFKSIKVEAVINGTIDKLISLLKNSASNKEWIYGTKESYILKNGGNSEYLSYTETEVPWPASNRDIPLSMQISQDVKSGKLHITAKGVPNAIPVKKGIVRIPYFNSWWNVQADKDKLFIEYFLEVDPGGSVPAWINNLFVARGPYETFSKLATLLR